MSPTIDMTGSDYFDTLTGYDELAIKARFGESPYRLQSEPLQFLRALIFVHRRRTGLKDAEAYIAAQDLPLSAVHGYFADDPDDLDPDHPDTDAGKGSTASGPTRLDSPPGA